jgi:branched-subunit amino acid ABC-type transport system permease component
MPEIRVKRLHAIAVICGIACYALAGVWIAMIIDDSPSNSGHLAVMAIVFWLIGTAVILSASYFRGRLLRLNQEKKPETQPN